MGFIIFLDNGCNKIKNPITMLNLFKKRRTKNFSNTSEKETYVYAIASEQEKPINFSNESFEKKPNIEEGFTRPFFSKNQEWLDELTSFTEENIRDFNFSVEYLATKMTMSRSQLFRRTKDLLGISPNQYIRESRLNKAKELLESRRVYAVKTAAYEVGLKDVAHFSKLFKNKFGILPSDYIY